MGSLVQAHPEAQERMCREMRPFLFNLERCLGTGSMVQGLRFKEPTMTLRQTFTDSSCRQDDRDRQFRMVFEP